MASARSPSWWPSGFCAYQQFSSQVLEQIFPFCVLMWTQLQSGRCTFSCMLWLVERCLLIIRVLSSHTWSVKRISSWSRGETFAMELPRDVRQVRGVCGARGVFFSRFRRHSSSNFCRDKSVRVRQHTASGHLQAWIFGAARRYSDLCTVRGE